MTLCILQSRDQIIEILQHELGVTGLAPMPTEACIVIMLFVLGVPIVWMNDEGFATNLDTHLAKVFQTHTHLCHTPFFVVSLVAITVHFFSSTRSASAFVSAS